MYEPHYTPYYETQREAVLALLKAHPEGVTIAMFCNFFYRTKKKSQIVTVGIGWEARSRVSEIRKDHYIDHAKRPDGTPAWFYRGPKVEADGQLLMPGMVTV